MFPGRYFGARYFAPRYFGKFGAVQPIIATIHHAVATVLTRSGLATFRTRGGEVALTGIDQ